MNCLALQICFRSKEFLQDLPWLTTLKSKTFICSLSSLIFKSSSVLLRMRNLPSLFQRRVEPLSTRLAKTSSNHSTKISWLRLCLWESCRNAATTIRTLRCQLSRSSFSSTHLLIRLSSCSMNATVRVWSRPSLTTKLNRLLLIRKWRSQAIC